VITDVAYAHQVTLETLRNVLRNNIRSSCIVTVQINLSPCKAYKKY